jgi:PAS domain-containing protein
MSSDSRSSEPGTLRIWVPHWAATVRITDNDYHSVATLTSGSATGKGPFPVDATLAPGVYSVQVEVGSTTDSEWVSVRSGKQTEIPAERWASLQLSSPMPTEATPQGVASTPLAIADTAEKWSRSTTWTHSSTGGGRLFVFVHTPDANRYPDFARGLSLLDQHGATLTRLADDAVRVDSAGGCLAFCADLAGGFYILQREGPGPFHYNQPVYVSDGWETQLFLTSTERPSFGSLAMNLAARGRGFERDNEMAAAVEAVLAALRRESAIATLMASSHLRRLLYAEDKNPWLGVLVAYALTVAEEASRQSYADASLASHDPGLKQDILGFLRHTLGSHPDVRALSLMPEEAASEPFPYPPLMRIGLQRVREHATRFTNTIPIESLTERILPKQIASSLWSLWSEPMPVVDTEVAHDVVVLESAVRPRGRAVPPAVDLGASAPVFRAPDTSPKAEAGTVDLRQVLYDLPTIKAARQMVGSATEGTDKVVVNSRADAKKLLSEIEPHALSAAAGIPLARVEQGLLQLQADVDGVPSKAPQGDRTERAILRFALRQGSQARGASLDAEPSAADDTLEESVTSLRNAAVQLSRVTPDVESDPSLLQRAQQLVPRLTRIADAIIGRADVIVLTDISGRFLYANGAFTLLVESPSEQFTPTCTKWCQWLSTLPLGRSTGRTSPADPRNRPWTVRRTEVEDEGTQTTAVVNILKDERWTPLPASSVETLSGTASSIALQASFVHYGSTKKVAAALEKLEGLAGKLESVVAMPGAAQ